MADLGVAWVRALQLEPEVRSDWELWLSERIKYLHDQMVQETDAIKLRWYQGHLHELASISAFIDEVMEPYRSAVQQPSNGNA